jgi:iron(III) transport system substrate-binding protein
VLILAPSAIMKDAQHPNAAKLFMEFLYSVEAAKLQADEFAQPLRPEVPSAPGTKPVDQVKLLKPGIEEVTKGVPEVQELWRDVFGV